MNGTLGSVTAGEVALSVDELVVRHPLGRSGLSVEAVAGISFEVGAAETLGLVGESGCGKTSAGRAIMQLPSPTSGSVLFEGQPLTGITSRALRRARTRLQMVFQDPQSSLNPRRSVYDTVREPLDVWGRGRSAARDAIVRQTLEEVGIDPVRAATARPHELSGGQCQRISIARALVLDPALLICDEPVSALDVSVQAQVLNLLEDLKARRRLTMIFVSHDLAVVKNVSDRVAVMYLGRLCEVVPSERLATESAHPYTRLLLAAVPDPTPGAVPAPAADHGEPPSPIKPPPGCRFHPRCPVATDVCHRVEPPAVEVAPGHHVACHHPIVTSVAISPLVATDSVR